MRKKPYERRRANIGACHSEVAVVTVKVEIPSCRSKPAPAGSPLTLGPHPAAESVRGTRVRRVLALLPAVTVTVLGVAAMAKSGQREVAYLHRTRQGEGPPIVQLRHHVLLGAEGKVRAY